ncbi:MAG: hypothetical protein K0R34_756 [Herbinix sp.]|nr:hypothetical protein [Herbinix sp.]
MMFSVIAVFRWSERLQGVPSGGYLEEYMDDNYGDVDMKQRFPHMKFIDVTIKTT